MAGLPGKFCPQREATKFCPPREENDISLKLLSTVIQFSSAAQHDQNAAMRFPHDDDNKFSVDELPRSLIIFSTLVGIIAFTNYAINFAISLA
jgi:hypothetical protein